MVPVLPFILTGILGFGSGVLFAHNTIPDDPRRLSVTWPLPLVIVTTVPFLVYSSLAPLLSALVGLYFGYAVSVSALR